jgi:hypothetical protein
LIDAPPAGFWIKRSQLRAELSLDPSTMSCASGLDKLVVRVLRKISDDQITEPLVMLD